MDAESATEKHEEIFFWQTAATSPFTRGQALFVHR